MSNCKSRQALSKQAVDKLRAWMFSEEHFHHPYPSMVEINELSQKTNLKPRQVSNWFINARKRIWQPKLREMGKDVSKFLSTGRTPPVGWMEEQRRQNPNSCASSKRKIESPLRQGPWTVAEEEYAMILLEGYKNGTFQVPTTSTLRCELAERLWCHPMRISKKFVGENSITKQLIRIRDNAANNRILTMQETHQFMHRIEKARGKFHASTEATSQKRPRERTISISSGVSYRPFSSTEEASGDDASLWAQIAQILSDDD